MLKNIITPRQPKLHAAQYIEAKTEIPVPRRYKSLREAIDSEKTFIIRSETPYEYKVHQDYSAAMK